MPNLYTNLFSMLRDKNILIRYDYVLNGKDYNTLLLSEDFLEENGIFIPGLIKKANFDTKMIDK